MTANEATTTVHVHVRVPIEPLFAWFIPIKLESIFHRFGPVPAVAGTSEQSGPWDTPGSSRTVHLGDGSTARERVTGCAAPDEFAYRVGEFSNSVRLIADHARGQWWFTAAGDGATDVRWSYTFVGRSTLAGLALRPFVALLWRPYMVRAMREFARLAEEALA